METRKIKFSIIGIVTFISAYFINRLSWSQKVDLLSDNGDHFSSLKKRSSFTWNSRKLGPSDWVNDLPINYTILNQTCPFKEKSSLNSALLMAFVGFGTEYWYLGYYTAFQYKAAFFLVTLICTIWLRLIPIPPGGDGFITLFITIFTSMVSFTCWTWQISDFLDLYNGRAVDACMRVPEQLWSFMYIYYWNDEIVISVENTTNATNITSVIGVKNFTNISSA